jgi:hypothetical protein
LLLATYFHVDWILDHRSNGDHAEPIALSKNIIKPLYPTTLIGVKSCFRLLHFPLGCGTLLSSIFVHLSNNNGKDVHASHYYVFFSTYAASWLHNHKWID